MLPELALGALSVAGDIYGARKSEQGMAAANAANLQVAREQMAFQREMSNTAYQRAAKDLDAAGLNRILALGNPATTPGGAMPVMQNEKAAYPAAFNAATAKVRSTYETILLKEQTNVAKTQALLNSENARKAGIEADIQDLIKGAAADKLKPIVDQMFDLIPGIHQSAKEAGPDIGKAYMKGVDVIGDKIKGAFESTRTTAKEAVDSVKQGAQHLKEKSEKAIDDLLDLKPLQLVPKSEKQRIREELQGLPYHEIQRRFRQYFPR